MTWLIIPAVLLIVMWKGVSVIRGASRKPSAAADDAAIVCWQKTRDRGFLLFCLKQVFPFVLGYCILGPLTRTWYETGSWSYPVERISDKAIFAVVYTLIFGWLRWKSVESRADEALLRRHLERAPALGVRDGKPG